MIIAIDPGSEQSAFVVMDEETYRPIDADKIKNADLLQRIMQTDATTAVIEMISSYGMPVGREVFQTCVWIGRYTEAAIRAGMSVAYIYRMEEKDMICHSPRANDATIRRALIDRFAQHDLKAGKGTKKNPDFFFGFRADMWAAFAVGATYLDKEAQAR